MDDHAKCGGDPKDVLLKALAPEIRARIAEALRRFIALVRESAKPKLTLDQISWVCGLAMMEGESLGTLAAAHGVSKQAFQQGASSFRSLFQVRSQSERDAGARQKMSKRNFRRGE
jgi:hypothetical protein